MTRARREEPAEPPWPEWQRRRQEHRPLEERRGVCECRWLEAKAEDLALYGLPGTVWFVCVDCGAGWTSGA